MTEHRSRATIDLDCLARNLERIRDRVGRSTSVLAVVKADGYGHGAIPIAETVLEYGAELLGLASTAEARELREAGIDAPLLILGKITEEEIPKLVEYHVRPTVQDPSRIERIGEAAKRSDHSLPVHLGVDTGMHRLGVNAEQVLDLAGQIEEHAFLELEGLSTHLSSAYREEGGAFTRQQLDEFNEVLERCRSNGFAFRYIHAANSGGVFRYSDAHFNLVRPGISLYGMSPGSLSSRGVELEPVMQLEARLLHLKKVPENHAVGYGRTFRTDRPMTLGVVSFGYNDGYPFQLSNDADVLLHGTRCPVIGRVTMDYLLIDAGRVEEAEVGDWVTLVGRRADEEITVDELAEKAGTISYDLLCSIGDRVHRKYVGGNDKRMD